MPVRRNASARKLQTTNTANVIAMAQSPHRSYTIAPLIEITWPLM